MATATACDERSSHDEDNNDDDRNDELENRQVNDCAHWATA